MSSNLDTRGGDFRESACYVGCKPGSGRRCTDKDVKIVEELLTECTRNTEQCTKCICLEGGHFDHLI